jgi:hypothetical protein
MSSALRQSMTLEQFLAWEDRQVLRYEFDRWQPVAMTGGTDSHEAIGGPSAPCCGISCGGSRAAFVVPR